MTYGLKEYKAFLDKNLKDLKDPHNIPFGVDPFGGVASSYRRNKSESINYAIEMLPDFKEPMKDHEFRDEVNALLELVKIYGHTQQLRANLRSFLYQFKDKVS